MSELSSILIRYRELLSEVDAWFVKCSLVSGDQISCERGCSACCRGLFDITLLDAFMLKDSFDMLPEEIKEAVLKKSRRRIGQIRKIWPDFDDPWLLNRYPEEDWDKVMPEEDETPCPLLGEDGSCMVYDGRPMTCRLNGIPLVDNSGEVLFDEWCSLNFTDSHPLEIEGLRFCFNEIFTQEQLLFREFTRQMFGRPFNELDTLIPMAVLIDFGNFRLPDALVFDSEPVKESL